MFLLDIVAGITFWEPSSCRMKCCAEALGKENGAGSVLKLRSVVLLLVNGGSER